MTRKLGLVLGIALVLVMVVTVACGQAAPAPAATVTVTRTASPAPASTITVTSTPPAVTVTATPTPTTPKLVKVRDAQATGGTALFYIAVGKNKGIFENNGIDETPLEMAVTAARMAPFLGQSEITGGDTLAFYTERKDIKTIGPHMNAHHSIMVRKDSPYKSLQDLKGKKLATVGPASAQYQMLKIVAKLEGLDLEKDFQLLSGAVTVEIGWLLNGEVDAITIYEPYTSKLLVSDGGKVRELYWLNDLYKKNTGSSYPQATMYTSEEWFNKNTDLARRISTAYSQTFTYVYAHDEVWKGDIAKKQWQIDDPKVLELLSQRMPGVVEFPSYGPAYKAALVKKTQLFVDGGLLPKEAVDWFKGTVAFAD